MQPILFGICLLAIVAVGTNNMDRRGMQAYTAELLQFTPSWRQSDCLWASATRAFWWESQNQSLAWGWHIRDDNLQSQGEAQDWRTVQATSHFCWFPSFQILPCWLFLYYPRVSKMMEGALLCFQGFVDFELCGWWCRLLF